MAHSARDACRIYPKFPFTQLRLKGVCHIRTGRSSSRDLPSSTPTTALYSLALRHHTSASICCMREHVTALTILCGFILSDSGFTD
jgi:hypothetical protein